MDSTFNFNQLLKNALINDSNNNINNNENKCLITNEPLLKDHITLHCKHKFNYNPLFKEVKKQKKYNMLEIQHLKKSQIKCPYCRYTQNGILPYYDYCPKIEYVNWPEKLSFKPNICSYIFLSGKKKGETCKKPCSKKYCYQHEKILNNRAKKKMLKQKNKIIKKPITLNNLENQIIQNLNAIHLNSYFIKCKQTFMENNKKGIIPFLHHTKNLSYFKCRCQHITISGKQCSKYIICSDKINLKHNKTTTPTFFKINLCHLHQYKDETKKQNNIINYPSNIPIDLENIPDKFLLDENTFNNYITTFYNKFYTSPNYKYNKFISFSKIINNS